MTQKHRKRSQEPTNEINVAKNIAMDRQKWKNIVNSAKNPAVPTAVYWLRGQRAPAIVS